MGNNRKETVRWGCVAMFMGAVIALTVVLGGISSRFFDPARNLVGLWSYRVTTEETVRFLDDGTVSDSIDGLFGPSTYELDGNRLTLISSLDGAHTYFFDVEGDAMQLTEIPGEGGIPRELLFVKIE